MPLSSSLLLELKKPFGKLIPDSLVSKESITKIIGDAPYTITIGDATTERLYSFGIRLDLAVVDGKERRIERNLPSMPAPTKFTCTNAAGTISDEAAKVIQNALGNMPATVIVKGEEDLLALVIFSEAPLGSAVFYGQPLEGMVGVITNNEKRDRARLLISKIKHSQSN